MTSTQRLELLRRELEAIVAHNESIASKQRAHDAWVRGGLAAAKWALGLTLASSAALAALMLFGVATGSTAGLWAAPVLLAAATIGLLMHGWLLSRLERGMRQWLAWLATTDETLPELPEHLRGKTMTRENDDHIEGLRRQLEGIIESGLASRAEGEEAWAFFDQLAEEELAGKVTRDQALALIHEFTEAQLAKRGGTPQ